MLLLFWYSLSFLILYFLCHIECLLLYFPQMNRLQEGISLINAMDINKVKGLLGRVCASLCAGHSQVMIGSSKYF